MELADTALTEVIFVPEDNNTLFQIIVEELANGIFFTYTDLSSTRIMNSDGSCVKIKSRLRLLKIHPDNKKIMTLLFYNAYAYPCCDNLYHDFRRRLQKVNSIQNYAP